MTHALIIPACDDANRGDQALVWETVRLLRDAGYRGRFQMLSQRSAQSEQSRREGITLVQPLLRHPSTRRLPRGNLRYGPVLMTVWGLTSAVDATLTSVLLTRPGRALSRVLPGKRRRATLASVEQADVCVIKGGGFLHSTGSVTDLYRTYFFLYHVILARAVGTPVLVMPNSFGPVEGRLSRALVRAVLRRCALVTARESISLAALDELGVPAEPYPDLGFTLEPEELAASPVAGLRERHPGRPVVGITVRPYRFPGSGDPAAAYRRYVAEMATFAGWLFEEGFLPVFVEHVLSDTAHESDVTAIRAVTARMAPGTFEVLSDPELTCRHLKSIYEECDYVVGTRFHSVIFSLAEGTPALALAYGGNKATGIMRDLDLGDLVVEIDRFTAGIGRARFALLRSAGTRDRLEAARRRTGAGREALVRRVAQALR